MSTTQTTDGAQAAQELFEGMFPQGYTPKIDTRTPADLGHHTSPSAAERASWKRAAA
jgi:hypothetical protein